MPDRSMIFAERLRSLREAAGLSQYALAKKSGLSKQALSQLELGAREPTWQTVQLLAGALDADCSAFVDPAVQPPDIEPARPRGRPKKADTPATDQAESEVKPSASAKRTGGGQAEEKGKKRKGEK